MRKFLMLMLLAVGFAACSNEEETTGGKDVQLAEGTPDKIEVYADDKGETVNEGKGVTFTTTGAWRATVNPVMKSAVTKAAEDTQWVKVVPDHGDAAGTYTIQIVLGVNATGEDRSATISITCGETVITITVEQKGTTEDGKVPEEGTAPAVPATTYPHLVSKIEFAYIPSRLEYSQKEELKRTYEFEYDGENRISGYSMRKYDYSGNLDQEMTGTLDYSTAGEIHVSEQGFEGRYRIVSEYLHSVDVGSCDTLSVDSYGIFFNGETRQLFYEFKGVFSFLSHYRRCIVDSRILQDAYQRYFCCDGGFVDFFFFLFQGEIYDIIPRDNIVYSFF